MTRILVTGSNGFIGRSLCEYLLARKLEVVPVVRRSHGMAGERIVDDSDPSALVDALVGCDALIHLAGAAQAPRGVSMVEIEKFKVAQVGLVSAWGRAAVTTGVRRFVYVSSAKVNGELTQDGERFRPSDEPRPQDAYAQSKWSAEQALRAITAGTDTESVIVRPPLVYGRGVTGNFAALVRVVRMGLPLPFGGISNQRSMIAVTNLSDFLVLCADADAGKLAAGRVFLVSDGDPVGTPDLLRHIAEAFGRKSRLLSVSPNMLRRIAGILGRPQAADRLLGSLVVDDSLARELLGWQPVITMGDQLRMMANAKNF